MNARAHVVEINLSTGSASPRYSSQPTRRCEQHIEPDNNARRNSMFRKMIVGIAAAATIAGAVALSATEASARHGFGGGGFRGGGHFAFHGGGFRAAHFGGFHRFGRFHHFGFRRARFFAMAMATAAGSGSRPTGAA
jgi:hypothetical protein